MTLREAVALTKGYMDTPAGTSTLRLAFRDLNASPHAAVAICVGRATGLERGDNVARVVRVIMHDMRPVGYQVVTIE